MLFLTLKSFAGLRYKSPLIHIDSNGFPGKTTPLSKAFGRVEWRDVSDIQLQKVEGDNLVVVNVDNTDNYTGRLSKMMWNMAYDAQNSKLI